MISLFRETRAIREFTDEPVPRPIIMSILDDAIWAPNHRFREPWRFIYAEGDGKQKLVASIDWKQHPRLVNTIIQAPLCLIVTAKTSNDEHIASEDFAAVCCLIQNIQMLSWAHGLGMTWNLGDDDAVVRRMLERIIQDSGLGEIVGQASDGNQVSIDQLFGVDQ